MRKRLGMVAGMVYMVKDELRNEWIAETVPLLTTDKIELAKRYTNKRDAHRSARVLAAELNRYNPKTVKVEAYL